MRRYSSAICATAQLCLSASLSICQKAGICIETAERIDVDCDIDTTLALSYSELKWRLEFWISLKIKAL